MNQLKETSRSGIISILPGGGAPSPERSPKQTESQSFIEKVVEAGLDAQGKQQERVKEKITYTSESLSKSGIIIDVQRLLVENALGRAGGPFIDFRRITRSCDKSPIVPSRRGGKRYAVERELGRDRPGRRPYDDSGGEGNRAKRLEVAIPSDVNRTGGIELLSASVVSSDSPFAVVSYAIDGEKQELGLRLDLDKQVFLDRTGDPRFDDDRRSRAVGIADVVSQSLHRRG